MVRCCQDVRTRPGPTRSPHIEWTMAPVLAHLQPRLPANQHALLAALVTLPSDTTNLHTLQEFPAWRDAAVEPVDKRQFDQR